MNFSRLFIVRPVATSLLMIALVLVGLVSVGFLPISSLPDVDYPTIQVQTFYPGASPQVMSTTVTPPRSPTISTSASPSTRRAFTASRKATRFSGTGSGRWPRNTWPVPSTEYMPDDN